MTPDLLPIVTALRACVLRVGYTADAVLGLLGPQAHAALGRGDALPARRVLAAGTTGTTGTTGQLGTLIALFLLADACPAEAAARALAPLTVPDALRAGLLEAVPDGTTVRAALDLRPVDAGHGSRWMISDLDGAQRPRPIAADHVLGVGQSSLSLLRATPTDPVATVLDLGTGCGVQAVMAAERATRVTGTDVNPRALAMARATSALNEIDLELREGAWYEPVRGRRFDRVVANPPFVVGATDVAWTYRDSGLDLDGASELVVRGAPAHLNPGGTAVLLASWIHTDAQDWVARVASWLPATGVDAWVVQRDVADPPLYVDTWLTDGGEDPRSVAGTRRAQAWLEHLAAAGVTGVGFGFVFLRRTDAPSDVLCEDLTHAFDDPLGEEASAYLGRVRWLATHDVGASVFALAPATALARVSVADPDGGWARDGAARAPGGRAAVGARDRRPRGGPAGRYARGRAAGGRVGRPAGGRARRGGRVPAAGRARPGHGPGASRPAAAHAVIAVVSRVTRAQVSVDGEVIAGFDGKDYWPCSGCTTGTATPRWPRWCASWPSCACSGTGTP